MTVVTAPSEEYHSRFNEEHYRHCQDCYGDHLDFMQEMEMEARMDEAGNNDEEYEDAKEELEEEVQDLTTELEHARDEIDVLQDEIDSFEDRYDEGYREGYERALENAINAVEGLQ